jgi:hypothetical protein
LNAATVKIFDFALSRASSKNYANIVCYFSGLRDHLFYPLNAATVKIFDFALSRASSKNYANIVCYFSGLRDHLFYPLNAANICNLLYKSRCHAILFISLHYRAQYPAQVPRCIIYQNHFLP